jgi:MFS family permease
MRPPAHGRLAGAAGRGRHLRPHHGRAPDHGPVPAPLNTSTGLGLASISLAFAFGQLWWGLTQPFAGAIADKLGAGRVLVAGRLLVALGTFITPYMTTTWGLIFAIGVLSAGGAGMAGPAVLMGGDHAHDPAEKRGVATGIVNAGGSTGQFADGAARRLLIVGIGWVQRDAGAGLLVLLCLPAAWVLRGNTLQPRRPAPPRWSAPSEAIRRRLRNRSYLLLAPGFFVCGFHVAFLATHLPGVVAACGLPTQWAGWALAMLGLFNIVGSLAMGWAVGPLAHEVAAVAAVRHARRGRAGVPVRAQDRPGGAGVRGRDGPDLPVDRAADGRAWSPSSSAPPTWPRCSAW